MDKNFWRGKNVLITGHTGFKGGWLALWLAELGAKVSGIALSPPPFSLYNQVALGQIADSRFCDIRDAESLLASMEYCEPEIVFHLAAQPLVRASYRQPVETFSTNVMGTVNVLEAVRALPFVRAVLMVTTDKVYKNQESVYPLRESDMLGGFDPYSASKAASELVISSYRDAFFSNQNVSIASARAGNVIGGGDWSEDRLLPDLIRAWTKNGVVNIRNPDSVRPWQHVLEPLYGYIVLAERLYNKCDVADAYNFGPLPHDAKTVGNVVTKAAQLWGAGSAFELSGSAGCMHEAGLLVLETALARGHLEVTPRWNTDCAIAKAIRWYKAFDAGENARKLCLADIESYMTDLGV